MVRFLSVLLLLIPALPACAQTAGVITVPLRSRHEVFRGSGDWQQFRVDQQLAPARTAIVICDMWDKHWCSGATARVGGLVEKMNPVLEAARTAGMTIIHAPSETMPFYDGTPQRRRMQTLAPFAPAQAKDIDSPPIPVDSSNGGCDTPPDDFYKAWSREHPGIRMADEDYVSDNGEEIYRLLRQKGITHLLVMGVHTNMCIMNRTFAIKQMTKWGVPCILVRDLTDAMYNPLDPPYVSHTRGTEMVIEHIEKYWVPTLLSGDLLRGLATLPAAR